MNLNDFSKYKIDIGDNRTTYYKAASLITELGFKNVAQTISTHCKYARKEKITINDSRSLSRKVSMYVIPEADILILLKHKQKLLKTPVADLRKENMDEDILSINKQIEILIKQKKIASSQETDHLLESHKVEMDDLDHMYADELKELTFSQDEEDNETLKLPEDLVEAKLLYIKHSYERKKLELKISYERKLFRMKVIHTKELRDSIDQPKFAAKIQKLKDKKVRILGAAGYK